MTMRRSDVQRTGLADLMVRLRSRLDAHARTVAVTIAEALVVGNAYGPGTPVDTGFARDSWSVGINGPAPGGPPRPEPGRPHGAGRGYLGALPSLTRDLMSVRAGDVVEFANAAEYFPGLEQGSSQQAPAGVIGLTAIEIPALAAAAWRATG